MYMFLVLLFVSIPVLVLGALALLKRETPEGRTPDVPLEHRTMMPAPRFFTDELAAPRLTTRLPREVLLNQIERHVRMEVAAAESFLDLPTAELLHAESASPILN
jgi:hypothetical protein